MDSCGYTLSNFTLFLIFNTLDIHQVLPKQWIGEQLLENDQVAKLNTFENNDSSYWSKFLSEMLVTDETLLIGGAELLSACWIIFLLVFDVQLFLVIEDFLVVASSTQNV